MNKNACVVRGVAYGLLAALVWGTWLALTRRGVSTNLAAEDIAALRFAVSGAILFPVVMKKGMAVGPWKWGGGLVLAVCVGAPYTLVISTALKHTCAAHAVLAYGAKPLFIALLARLMFSESLSGQRCVGFFVSICGLFILSLSIGSGKSGFSIYHFYFFLAALCWAIFTTVSKVWRVEALHGTAIVAVLSCVIFLPYYLWEGKAARLMLVPWQDILIQAVIQGIFAAIIALWAYSKAILFLGATRAGLFPILTPVIGTVIAIPLLDEIPTGAEVGGIAMVCIGFVVALNLKRPSLSRNKVSG